MPSKPARTRVCRRCCLAFGLVVFAIAACMRPSEPASVDACLIPTVDTSKWQRIDRRLFAFRLPHGYDSVSVRPIDSHAVGLWKAGALRTVGFDAGWYSSSLQDIQGKAGSSSCRDVIGGLPVLIVSGWHAPDPAVGPSGQYFVAAAWRDLRPGFHFTLHAGTPSREEQEILLAVLRSVHFNLEVLGPPPAT